MGSASASDENKTKLGWGIIGTGGIARQFADAVNACKTGQLVAVGSRTAESAARFGDKFDIPRRYDSYDALLADPEVDAIYISLPNHLHLEWTVRCAEAGKQILCEKPLTVNASEALIAVEAARARDVFLMEAFMYRCHPQTAKLVELIREKVIGDVRVIQAHFGYNLGGPRLDNIRQQHASAGGGIMDVGCYCVSAARLIAGVAMGQDFAEPLDLKAVGYLGGVSHIDEWATAVCRFPGDIIANLTCATQANVDPALRIWGSEGHIIVTQPWRPDTAGSRILVYRDGRDGPEEIATHTAESVYSIEADTVAANIPNRQAPSPCMTWADTLGNMRMLDRWRQSVGLFFEGEKP